MRQAVGLERIDYCEGEVAHLLVVMLRVGGLAWFGSDGVLIADDGDGVIDGDIYSSWTGLGWFFPVVGFIGVRGCVHDWNAERC